ncbi:MAG: DmsC/YnfH family molybdoenzyme membrane anchor subunit [Acidobacteriota bacterium]
MNQRAFLFDVNRCTGCQACEVACAIENQLEDVSWRQVVTLNESRLPSAPTMHLSVACNHCADPPCMAACPALAYSKDPLTGRVDLDPERCIGCGYCSWACPYDAPTFDRQAGVMTKCTFCSDRQAVGLEPACVEQCPTGALGFGELTKLPGGVDGVGMPTLEPAPSIRFIPWNQDQRGPAACSERSQVASPPSAAGKISLRSEWPLMVFTLAAAILVASHLASQLGFASLPLPAFLAIAAVGMGTSTAHLGKPLRAWRALLNPWSSWLSREITLFSAFMGAAAWVHVGWAPPWLDVLTGVLGVAALFAIDRVYDLARAEDARPVHSADVLLTAALLVALLAGEPKSLALLAFIKIALYLNRKRQRRRRGLDPLWKWSLARVGLGSVPIGLLVLGGGAVAPAGALIGSGLAVLLAEVIDRGELYEELEVPTPRGEMRRELAARLSGA